MEIVGYVQKNSVFEASSETGGEELLLVVLLLLFVSDETYI